MRQKNQTQSVAARIQARAGQRTRVAIVGAGYIADIHLSILSELSDIEVVIVADHDLAKAKDLARRFKIPNAVASIEQFSPGDVDVAHVLVPPDRHVEVCRQLLEMGVGVFAEKPLALQSSDARELDQLADSLGLPLAVNHNLAYHPLFLRLLETARSGRIGRIEHVRVYLSIALRQLEAGDFSHWMFRTPRNIIFEQAVHPFSQLQALLGPIKTAETSLLSTRELQEGQLFHDRWSIAAVAEGGTAQIEFGFGTSFERSTVEVLGTDGSIEIDLLNELFAMESKTLWMDFWNSFLAGWRRGGQQRRGALRKLFSYLTFTIGIRRREDAFYVGMSNSISRFHDALRGGEALPANSLSGAQVLDWCEAATARVPATESTTEELPTDTPARPGEIVVFGGTGFIGSRVVERLLDKNIPVTVALRRSHSLPQQIVDGARSGKLRIVRASLEDKAAISNAVRGAHSVIQLATGGGPTWEVLERSMIAGSKHVGEACVEHGVKRMIYVSSTAALYLGADAGREVSDAVGTDPLPDVRAIYGRAKIVAEDVLNRLQKDSGLPLVIVRPAIVLGEGSALQHSGLGLWVRDNHCVGWGQGDTPLPLILVDDVADALVRAVLYEGDQLNGKAMNLAANTGFTGQEVVDEMRRATGRDLHFHPRALWWSQALELGKWVIKKIGRQAGAVFPSWRDLKSRAMVPILTCETARDVLGWKPVEDREEFLDRAIRGHAPGTNTAEDTTRQASNY